VRAPRGLWPYVGASLLLHGVAFFVYVRAVSGARVPVPYPAAYRVSLVQLPGARSGGAAPAPAPEEKKDEKTVRLPEKPRPMKKTEPEKKKPDPKKETREREESAPGGKETVGAASIGSGAGTGAGVGVGTGSGSGVVSVEGGDFPFLYYLALIEARIGDRWVPPEGLASGAAPPSATVRFVIFRDGGVHDPEIAVSSGISYFDLSAIRAVLDSDPFPPLPEGFPGERLGVNFVFRYEG
jgi:TonB family protein